MTAIEFENVGKQYRLGLVSTQTLSHDLHRWWTVNVRGKEDPYLRIGDTNDRSVKGSSDYVWALRDINFKVEQGDVVGIIGRNGAGKSTLLKLLSKVTGPSTGIIRARGRIGSLLEVGTGFHPEMTGRENIFMNGAILGMTRAEITRKLDEIVDFSGCERYLDTPVKRYSSGMMVRLGFAVAAHLDPEILVVDEVLAVGDAEFQKKAIGKMQDVSRGEGRTVLFVSHNMAAVRSLCKSGIVLKNGTIDFTGTANNCVDHYLLNNITSFDNTDLASIERGSFCKGDARITSISFLDELGHIKNPHCGGYLRIRVTFDVYVDRLDDCFISMDLATSFGSTIMNTPSNMTMPRFTLSKGKHHCDLIFEKLPLTVGTYIMSLWLGNIHYCSDMLDNCIRMDVAEDDFYVMGTQFAPHMIGKIVLCDYKWSIE